MLMRLWPSWRGAMVRKWRARGNGSVAAAAEPIRAERRRLWALLQTRPRALVLAVSDSRADLERELAELNETWNHKALRTEPRAYDIQPACLLQTGRDPAPARAGAASR